MSERGFGVNMLQYKYIEEPPTKHEGRSVYIVGVC